MRLKMFYKKQNLTRSHFSKMIGVSDSTIKKYELKQPISKAKTEKIEAGVKLVKKLKLVYPDMKHYFGQDEKKYAANKKKAAALDQKFSKEFSKIK